MGNGGLCRRCGGSGRLWTGVRLVWCRCSGLSGAAPDPAAERPSTVIPVERWPEVRARLLGGR